MTHEDPKHNPTQIWSDEYRSDMMCDMRGVIYPDDSFGPISVRFSHPLDACMYTSLLVYFAYDVVLSSWDAAGWTETRRKLSHFDHATLKLCRFTKWSRIVRASVLLAVMFQSDAGCVAFMVLSHLC
jgi:hypothetical protein